MLQLMGIQSNKFMSLHWKEQCHQKWLCFFLNHNLCKSLKGLFTRSEKQTDIQTIFFGLH